MRAAPGGASANAAAARAICSSESPPACRRHARTELSPQATIRSERYTGSVSGHSAANASNVYV